jgi:RimJ/RimL family protein N-acetyltransferase/catechol 2,3-dioxygenase-like lactoylglutathione lyase family enzyme
MRAPPLVETPRLVLSAPADADAELIFRRYASDQDVTRYLGWPRHRTLADTQAFLAFSAVQWEREGAGPYLIWARADGQLLGSTGLDLEPGRSATTGYVLATTAWGKGYATEAVKAMVAVAPDIGVSRLHAWCHPDHRASLRVLEKCGFERDKSWDRQMEFPNLAPGIRQDAFGYGRDLGHSAGESVTGQEAGGKGVMSNKARFQEAHPFQKDVLALPVADLDAASRWYCEHFGMAEVERHDQPVPTVVLQRDSVRIGFAMNGGDPAQDGATVLVSNIRGIKDELEANGTTVGNWRVDERAGHKYQVFFVVAPDGLCYYFHEPIEEGPSGSVR